MLEHVPMVPISLAECRRTGEPSGHADTSPKDRPSPWEELP
jgi:hypothetical protein